MPAEQSIPEGSPRVELGPLTEVELRTPGAIKLTHLRFTELQGTCRTVVAELQAEKQRNETLTYRAQTSETKCCVLEERLGATGYRDVTVRFIELVILGLLAFAIDAARNMEWGSLACFLLMSVVLGIAIILIQRGYRPKQGEKR